MRRRRRCLPALPTAYPAELASSAPLRILQHCHTWTDPPGHGERMNTEDEDSPQAWEWTGPIHDRDPVLHQAAYLGDLNKIKEVLAVGGSTDSEELGTIDAKNRLGCTPLRLAATGGHSPCVKYLIDCGADVNLSDVKAQTPLYVAIKTKHLNCAKILLAAGANPNGDERCLCTPLYIASMDGFVEGVRELVRYGADLDTSQIRVGSFISTPLYITIAYQHLDCFKTLLQAGADPDYGCDPVIAKKRHLPNCQSLFHYVVRKSSCKWQFAALLREFGANMWLTDDKGKMAFELNDIAPSECKQYIQEVIGCPLALTHLCRVRLRHHLGRSKLVLVPQLPLPQKMIAFLEHNE
ncbi:PREDICTED: ankyrin repeat and SOCS box protein 1-like [Priapulus caudatus]|uniref:Ankyrin repeat and SOCS box protein 1-like n=1 Tax=Priapulus caudatus TaxID=37621 RepID=A0ABM1E8R6_PRICU|nr:PREDICTED: ankyrin repeat and SOCS box protein 1-like [Priapulus caudatus]